MKRIAFFLSFGLSAWACQRSKPLTVKDTEGRAFIVKCGDAQSPCTLSPTVEGKYPEGTQPVLRGEGRLLGVCDAVGEGAQVHPADCRPLLCEENADCPPSHGPGTGACIDKLCVDASHPVLANDAVMLCLAGTGVGHGTPRQVERYALGLNCGTPCVVPSPCRQP